MIYKYWYKYTQISYPPTKTYPIETSMIYDMLILSCWFQVDDAAAETMELQRVSRFPKGRPGRWFTIICPRATWRIIPRIVTG